ncbi:Uncharacterised protein [Mycobacterium tuberculosis]|uniref:Uncharacterized protein n=2 Tax=Mycobacterium tuberculosis TaxID=1773 RepID=A0A655HLL1_MYCTX|nr:Uncharacterised protein [Mycobacterium tuberculosis]CNV98148.1 Uncharacterised protein [Mycobacterium tuberculosis]COU64054.1 Uncharacterised protein [Mycobacterium tuberculosis]
MAAGSLAPGLVGLHTHTRVLFCASRLACTHGSCHFHRPSCGAPHIPLVSTPPNCCMPAAIAPLVVVFDGYKKPDIEPAKPKRSGWKAASAIAP